jgi:hypothetical protein
MTLLTILHTTYHQSYVNKVHHILSIRFDEYIQQEKGPEISNVLHLVFSKSHTNNSFANMLLLQALGSTYLVLVNNELRHNVTLLQGGFITYEAGMTIRRAE